MIDLTLYPDLMALRGDPAALLAAVNAKTIRRTNTDLLTSRAIVVRHGPEFAAQVMGGFLAAKNGNPLLEGIWIALNSTGINFSDPLTQDMIDQLAAAGVWTSEAAERLKSFGIWYESIALQSLGRDATADDVVVSLAAVSETERRNSISVLFAEIANTWINPASVDGVSTAEEVRARIKVGL